MGRLLKIWPVLILLTTLLSVGVAQGQESVSAAPVAAPATVWVGVRVVDAQGWEYAGVRLRWVQDRTTLEIRRVDGAIKLFLPEQVVRVFDADGADITNEVGTARNEVLSVPPLEMPATDASGTESRLAPANRGATLSSASDKYSRRLFNTAIDAGVGYGSASGNWFSGLAASANASGGIRFMIGERDYIHLSYRYQSFAERSFEIFDFSAQIIDVESVVHEFQFLLGRHASLVADKAVKSVGYGEIGVAALNHRFKFSTGGEETLTRIGFVAQGGLLVLMSEAVGLDLSASAVWKPGWSGDEGSGFILGGHAGLTFFF